MLHWLNVRSETVLLNQEKQLKYELTQWLMQPKFNKVLLKKLKQTINYVISEQI